MLKKILYVLIALLLFFSAITIGLHYFFDPAQYTQIIKQKFQQKTNYQVNFNDDISLTLWPRSQIETTNLIIRQPNNETPFITADKIKFSISFWSLITKKIEIKEIVLDTGKININDDEKSVPSDLKPDENLNGSNIENKPNKKNNSNFIELSKWSELFNRFEMKNSDIHYRKNNKTVTLHLDNASFDFYGTKIDLKAAGNVLAEPTWIDFTTDNQIDLIDPHTMDVMVKNVSYEWKQNVQSETISGQINTHLQYRTDPMSVILDDLTFSLGENQITGNLNMRMKQTPYIKGAFYSSNFDVNKISQKTSQTKSNEPVTEPLLEKKYKNKNKQKQENLSESLAFLKLFDAEILFKSDQFKTNSFNMSNVLLAVTNRKGIVDINSMQSHIAKGKFSGTGKLDVRNSEPFFAMSLAIFHLDLASLAPMIHENRPLKGIINVQFDVSSVALNLSQFIKNSKGTFTVHLSDANLLNINISQMLSTSLARFSKKPAFKRQNDNNPIINGLDAEGRIDKGILLLRTMNAHSDTIAINGGGKINLNTHQLDLPLQFILLDGWNNDNKLIDYLRGISIPIRLFGAFDEIHYKLDIDNLIKSLSSFFIESDKAKTFRTKVKQKLKDNSY